MLIKVRIYVNIFLILLNFLTYLGIIKPNKINRIFAFDAFAIPTENHRSAQSSFSPNSLVFT